MLRPSLRFRYHHLGETIGPFVRLDSNLAIGSKNINGLENSLVDILNKFFDRLIKYYPILLRDRAVVFGWEIDDARCSFCLLSLTLVCLLALGTIYEQSVELPGLFVFKVVEWR